MDDYKICDCGSGKIELQCCGDKPSKKEKEEIISKELLSEVLPFASINDELISFGLSKDGDILLQYPDADEIINIHELAHECKKWALDSGYNLTINPLVITISQQLDLMYYKHAINNETGKAYDPIDVIKSAQWILENKEK